MKVNANMRLSSSMSRLELSFSPKWMSENGTTIPIGEFLEKIFGILHRTLAQGDYTSVDRAQVIIIIHADLGASD